MHTWFIDRLVPVCAELLDAAVAAGEMQPGMDALNLMYGVGHLCVGVEHNARYDTRRMVNLVIAGLQVQKAAPSTPRAISSHQQPSI